MMKSILSWSVISIFLKKQWSTTEAFLKKDANIRGYQLIISNQKTEKNQSYAQINWASEWEYWKSSTSDELTNFRWHIVGP